MAKKASGSKNNINARGEKPKPRMLDGKPTIPFFYYGKRVGHSNYMAAKFEGGEIAVDRDGKPVRYNAIAGDISDVA